MENKKGRTQEPEQEFQIGDDGIHNLVDEDEKGDSQQPDGIHNLADQEQAPNEEEAERQEEVQDFVRKATAAEEAPAEDEEADEELQKMLDRI